MVYERIGLWSTCVHLKYVCCIILNFCFSHCIFQQKLSKTFSPLRHLLACCQNLLAGQEWPLISSRVASEDTSRHTHRTWTEVYYRNAKTSKSFNRSPINAMPKFQSLLLVICRVPTAAVVASGAAQLLKTNIVPARVMKWLWGIRQNLISKFLLVIAQYWQQFGEVRVAMFVPGHSGSNHPHLSTSCQGNVRNIVVLFFITRWHILWG